MKDLLGIKIIESRHAPLGEVILVDRSVLALIPMIPVEPWGENHEGRLIEYLAKHFSAEMFLSAWTRAWRGGRQSMRARRMRRRFRDAERRRSIMDFWAARVDSIAA